MGDLCRRSGGLVRVTGTSAELEENLAQGRISAVLGVEGGQALEAQPERVRELRGLGVRFMSLTHLANNELGGSSSGSPSACSRRALGSAVSTALQPVLEGALVRP
jgi:membrane dipeptidase